MNKEIIEKIKTIKCYNCNSIAYIKDEKEEDAIIFSCKCDLINFYEYKYYPYNVFSYQLHGDYHIEKTNFNDDDIIISYNFEDILKTNIDKFIEMNDSKDFIKQLMKLINIS